MPLSTVPTINSVSIPVLLDWWQQRKRIASARVNLSRSPLKHDDTYLQAYYRLMEVYSVVKSGGVKAQTEAVNAFSQRESSLLRQRLAEIDTDSTVPDAEKQHSKAMIQQELEELRSANNWRLNALTNINPDEEALVKAHLSDIERTLIQTKCA